MTFLALQRNVRRDVAREIRNQANPARANDSRVARPVNPQAHVAYLQGLFFLNKRSPVALDKSVNSLTKQLNSTRRTPRLMLGAPITYIYLGSWASSRPERLFLKPSGRYEALELDETLADAYAALGQVSKHMIGIGPRQRNVASVLLELSPSSWLARGWYAGLLSTIGRFEQSSN